MRIMPVASFEPGREGRDAEPVRAPERREAPAGTWQAARAERQRQAASHMPAPRRQEGATEPRARQITPLPADSGQRRCLDAGEESGAAAQRVEARQQRQGGNGGDQGQGGSVAAPQSAALATADAQLAELAASIATQAPGQELFELLLPGGERLGVLLAPGADRVLRILLSCSDAGLRRRLEEGRMELEQGLTRRMQQATCVTVL